MRRPSVIWDDIQSSLWFLSGLMTFAGGVMAWLVLRFDTWRIASEMDPLSWTFGGGADSARQILSTIMPAMGSASRSSGVSDGPSIEQVTDSVRVVTWHCRVMVIGPSPLRAAWVTTSLATSAAAAIARGS